jgi:flagellin-like protein
LGCPTFIRKIDQKFTTIISTAAAQEGRMQGKGRRKQRKAVSPVLATVILIAITLIAAVAIAGFVFGLFGAFTSTAQVSITSVSCNASQKLCTLTLTNSGTASTYSGTSGTITFGGQTYTMQCGSATISSPVNTATVQISAGGSNQISCSFSGSPQAGQQFVGTVSLGNGGQVQFSGTFGQ